MGASDFFIISRGKTAEEAFVKAIEKAPYDHGHGGYTGTIAEKNNFVMIKVPEEKDPWNFAEDLMNFGDPRIDDKYGPAGCVKLDKNRYLFFGWASS